MRRIAWITCLFVLVSAGWLFADARADAVMRQSYALPEAQTMRATMYMLLVDTNGTQSLRVLSMYTRKDGEGTDSYTEFLSPPDVKGTKFLSLASEGGDEVQRIWLPELRKVRRIAGGGRGEKFVGSDLTYYDMEKRHVGDARYSMVGEGKVNASSVGTEKTVDCWIIDSWPVDRSAPYGRIRLWVGKDDSFIYRSTMWNRASDEVKSIYILEVEKRNGIIIPVRTGVVAADGHKTLLQMNDVVLDGAVDPELFTIANLER